MNFCYHQALKLLQVHVQPSNSSNKYSNLAKKENLYCIFLSCHIRVSEWIYTLYFYTLWSLSDCNGTQTHMIQHDNSQMRCTDQYSQHSSIIWPVWLNDWVFVHELSGCGFHSRYSHLEFTLPSKSYAAINIKSC